MLDPDAAGSFTGLRLGHSRDHLARAALEGVVFAIRAAFDALPAGRHRRPDVVRIAGGGSLDGSWRQLLADVLRRELAAVDVPDASARGVALLAGFGTGTLPGCPVSSGLAPQPVPIARPDAAAADRYDRGYARFVELTARESDAGEVDHASPTMSA